MTGKGNNTTKSPVKKNEITAEFTMENIEEKFERKLKHQ